MTYDMGKETAIMLVLFFCGGWWWFPGGTCMGIYISFIVFLFCVLFGLVCKSLAKIAAFFCCLSLPLSGDDCVRLVLHRLLGVCVCFCALWGWGVVRIKAHAEVGGGRGTLRTATGRAEDDDNITGARLSCAFFFRLSERDWSPPQRLRCRDSFMLL